MFGLGLGRMGLLAGVYWRVDAAPLPAPTTVQYTAAQVAAGMLGAIDTARNAARIYGSGGGTGWVEFLTSGAAMTPQEISQLAQYLATIEQAKDDAIAAAAAAAASAAAAGGGGGSTLPETAPASLFNFSSNIPAIGLIEA